MTLQFTSHKGGGKDFVWAVEVSILFHRLTGYADLAV